MSGIKDLERFELTEPNPVFAAQVIRRVKASQEAQAIIARALAGIKTRMPDNEDIKAEDLYTWSAVISNQSVDSYFTRMADSSLKNYAADAETGVAFLTGHNHQNLPCGYSTAGRFEATGTPVEEFPRVVADFYTVRDLVLDGVDTNMLIKAIEFGIARDVSIGFKHGVNFEYSCSICGLDLWDWDCWHIPGAEYTVIENPDDEPDKQIEVKELCVAWVKNARLSEVSAVYDGATSNAMIVKATRELRAGRLKPETERFLQSAYRMAIPRTNKKFALPDNTNKREENMANENNNNNQPSGTEVATMTALRGIVNSGFVSGVTANSTGEDIVRAIQTEMARLRGMEKAATEGKELRSMLVDETLAEGVRAFGKDFKREEQEKMMADLNIGSIKSLRSSWKQIGDSEFANKKRASQDNPNAENEEDDEENRGEGEGNGKTPKTENREVETSDDLDESEFDFEDTVPSEGFGGV